MLHRNKALLLVKISDVIFDIQSECCILANHTRDHTYTMLKFIYDIGSCSRYVFVGLRVKDCGCKPINERISKE